MTIHHIKPGCPILAKEQLHITTCKEIQVQLHKEHWYEHTPKFVETRQERNSFQVRHPPCVF